VKPSLTICFYYKPHTSIDPHEQNTKKRRTNKRLVFPGRRQSSRPSNAFRLHFLQTQLTTLQSSKSQATKKLTPKFDPIKLGKYAHLFSSDYSTDTSENGVPDVSNRELLPEWGHL